MNSPSTVSSILDSTIISSTVASPGWEHDQDREYFPAPVITPPNSPSPSLPVLPIPPPTSVISVDIPSPALRTLETPTAEQLTRIAAYLEDSHFALPLDAHLDQESPLFNLIQTFRSNERLQTLVISPSPTSSSAAQRQLIKKVKHDIREGTLLALYHLGALTFFNDINRYLRDLARASRTSVTIPRLNVSTPSASSSPLNGNEEAFFEWINAWWTGGGNSTPLPPSHPRYHEGCFQCHRLGHYRVNCRFYQCPSCLEWSPGHVQAQCPLSRRSQGPSISPISSRSSRSSRGNYSQRRTHRMTPASHRPRRATPPVPRSPSPDYGDDMFDEDAMANMTSSPGWSSATLY